MKKTNRMIWIMSIIFLAIAIGCTRIETIQAQQEVENVLINVQGYTMETVLAQSEKIENELVAIEGYVKFENDGVIVYYTKNDYLYDTKENAVWLPEREDLPIDEYFCYDFFEDVRKYLDGEYCPAIRAVIQEKQEDSEFAAVALYCELNDKVWNSANSSLKTTKIYDRVNEQQEAETVSIYRLLGDPWSYDGKKVYTEGYSYQEGARICPNIENNQPSIKWASEMYGEPTEWMTAYTDLINEFRQKEKYKNLSSDDMMHFIELATVGTKARLNIEMMFYMYNIENYQLDDTSVNYVYWPCKVTIHKKDIEKSESHMDMYISVLLKSERENEG